MGTFNHGGDHYNFPDGWEGLNAEDFYFKLESLRDQQMKAEELDLPSMTDEDGDELDPEEVVVVQAGFEDGGHFEAIRAWAPYHYSGSSNPTDAVNFEMKMSGIAREKLMSNQIAGAGDGLLAPVDGVSLEQWAGASAQLAQGGDINNIIAGLGIDRAKWDSVNQEWTGRMSTDTTFTVSTAYSNAFAAGSSGQYSGAAQTAVAEGVGGDLGEEPISYEKYIEIMIAMEAADQQGKNISEVLAGFGMSEIDYSNVSQFWNKKMQEEMMTYSEKMDEFRAKYAPIYGLQEDVDDDDDDDDDDDWDDDDED